MAVTKHDYRKFLTDRAGGYEAEEWLIDLLASKGHQAERFHDQNTTYDVRRTDGVTYEVKRDRLAYDRYNAIYVEAFNAGKSSGITISTGGWWVHLIGDDRHDREALFFRRDALLRLALQHNRLISCGQGPSYTFKVPTAIARAAASSIVPHELA